MNRLRHDLVKEGVVGFSGLVLFSVFYYILNDFLNREIRQISDLLHNRFASLLLLISFLILIFLNTKLWLTEWSSSNSLYRFAERMGESPKVLALYNILRITTIFTCLQAPSLLLIHASIYPMQASGVCLWLCSSLVLTGVCTALGLTLRSSSIMSRRPSERLDQQTQASAHNKAPLAPFSPANRLGAQILQIFSYQGSYPVILSIAFWKVRILSTRSRVTRFCLFFSMIFCFFNAYLAYAKLPFVSSAIASLSVGFFMAAALCFQCSEDLSYAWLEKNLGVSHKQYLRAVELCCISLGLLIAFFNAVLWLLVSDLEFLDALRIFMLTMTGPFLVPYLLFQIDAKKPLVCLISIFLGTLLLGTALYASLFAIALLPFIASYGHSSQEGRYYR